VVVWGESGRAQATAAGDLYVARADATHPRLLKRWGAYGRDSGAYGAFNARWSPDRSRIGLSLAVFYADPGSQVAVIEPSGRGLRSLTRGWERQFEDWTQDGGGLIHGAFWASGPFQVVPVMGGRSRTLRIAGAGNYRLDDFDWSWRAGRIAASLSERGIVTMSHSGRDLKRITHGDDVQPLWSPDGRTILFTRLRFNGIDDVFTVKPNGSGLRRLVSGSGIRGMDWSPDGRKVLFIRGEPIPGTTEKESYALWVMNADGSATFRLPFNRAGWDVVSADW
jgi:Tol biopolymer transport system component